MVLPTQTLVDSPSVVQRGCSLVLENREIIAVQVEVWKGVTIGTCFYSRQQRQGKGTSLGVGREHAMAMRAKAQAAGHGAAPGRGVVPPVRR
ncbi:uncharacterized protein LOC107868177 isoform X2 [Capsicum annuum]|uniref:uncharacterized protein LOC107868177 isoform X2 n=1 Tax=Capsicum annuum TaxID=4072 RepID=UPI001FB06B6C|nr:uncharacterized protein LOC107868177 isoform X2 [Capsicum annuum]